MPFFGKDKYEHTLGLAREIVKCASACDEAPEVSILKALKHVGDEKRIKERLVKLINKEEKSVKKGYISHHQLSLKSNGNN